MQWIPIWARAFVLLLLFSSSIVKGQSANVISAAPSITQIIYFLNAENLLVARSDFCKEPSRVQELPSIGTPYHFNYERAVKLKARYVIAPKTSLINFKQKLKKLNITLLEISLSSIKDLYKSLRLIGNVLNLSAERKIIGLQKEMKILTKNKFQGRYLFVYDVSRRNSVVNGFYVASESSIYSDFLNEIGLENISTFKGSESHYMSNEQIIKFDPKYLFFLNKVQKNNSVIQRLKGKKFFFLQNEDEIPGPLILKLFEKIIFNLKKIK